MDAAVVQKSWPLNGITVTFGSLLHRHPSALTVNVSSSSQPDCGDRLLERSPLVDAERLQHRMTKIHISVQGIHLSKQIWHLCDSSSFQSAQAGIMGPERRSGCKLFMLCFFIFFFWKKNSTGVCEREMERERERKRVLRLLPDLAHCCRVWRVNSEWMRVGESLLAVKKVVLRLVHRPLACSAALHLLKPKKA